MLCFLTNEIVLDEWERNKLKTQLHIDSAKKTYDGCQNHLNFIEKTINDKTAKKEIIKIKLKLKNEFDKKRNS